MLREFDGTDWTYPLADALGSVRQLVDASGAPVMAQNYAPYGDVLESYGAESSNYGYAGEWTDGTGLQYLRARYLNTGIGRFISRDTWGGDYDRPMSLNRWGYVEGNPVNRVDPSGYGPCPGAGPECTTEEDALNHLMYRWAYPAEKNNNPADPPPLITWAPSVDINYAVITNSDGDVVPPGTYQSQFNIDEQSCGIVVVDALAETYPGQGQLDMTANRFYELAIDTIGTGVATGTGGVTLSNFINAQTPWSSINYRNYGPGDGYVSVPNLGDTAIGLHYLREFLYEGAFSIVGVGVNSSSGKIGVGDPLAYHWVVVTGLSAEWNLGEYYQWVRIYNPFNNITEYYPYYWFDIYFRNPPTGQNLTEIIKVF